MPVVVVNRIKSHGVCVALLDIIADDVEGQTSVANSFFQKWKLDAKALASDMALSGSPWITEGLKWGRLVKAGGIASPDAEAYVASLKGQCTGVAAPTTIAPTAPPTTVVAAPAPNQNVVTFCKAAMKVSSDVLALEKGQNPPSAVNDAGVLGEDSVLAGGQWATETHAVSTAMTGEDYVTTNNDLTQILKQCTNYLDQFS